MKVGMKKTWWSIPMLLVLAAIAYYGYLQQDKTSTNIMFFRIGTEDTAETISAWYNDEGTYYVFLPSYADIHTVTAAVNPAYMVEVDGTALTSETDLSAFTLCEPYNIRITHGWETAEEQICFLQSANVATMYIDTQSGSMQHIHADKEYRESVQVRLIDANGGINYCGANDKLKGRGNTTWSADKKPYLLTLQEARGLLGMNAAEKWVLLANAFDTSCIKTKIIYDFASDIGLEVVPSYEYIDLFLNGQYVGLYLICEKAEDVFNRVIDNDICTFLCVLDFGKGNLHTKSEQPFYISSPENVSKTFEAYVCQLVQELEDEILYGENSELISKSIIDYDSWVKRYLVDEVFENWDSCRKSSFFYYDSTTEKFYAGPLWDVDCTWGGSLPVSNPNTFFASEEWRAQSIHHPWYYWLFRNEEFKQRVCSVYQSEAVKIIDKALDFQIDRAASQIALAQSCNEIRWRTGHKDIEELKTFLRERKEFLNSAWIENENYFFVQLEYQKNGEYLNYSIKPGNTLPQLFNAVTAELETPVWRDRDTGEIFDINQPITKDTTLILDSPEVSITSSPLAYISLHKAMLFRLAIVGLSGVVLLALVWIDYKRNRVTR